jgi:lysophospholipid acyltransferase (LPLAT)-like uncharacterized protein
VPTAIDTVYKPASLEEYSFFGRLKIRAAAAVFYAAIRLIGSTVKFEVRGLEHFDDVERDGKVPIYAFWHDRIFLGTYFFRDRGIVVMTSRSFDGEYIARFIQKFGYGAIRGSSSRGGSRALVTMIKGMRRGLPMSFTLDGPRGPRYVAKGGAAILAKRSGNPLVPFVLEPKDFWTLKSWDGMQIPRPFTSALVTVGEPIYLPANADDRMIEAKRVELEASLTSLVEEGRAWRELR